MLSVFLLNSEQNKHTACSILYAKYGYITHFVPHRGLVPRWGGGRYGRIRDFKIFGTKTDFKEIHTKNVEYNNIKSTHYIIHSKSKVVK